ncbi:unnamed protein product, partial [Rotaria magnacalcarata]
FFPVPTGASIKALNERVREQYYFLNILPYIDKVNNFQRSCYSLLDVDWKVCYSHNEKEEILKLWREEQLFLKKENTYANNFLFLLIQYDRFITSELNIESLPNQDQNAIVLKPIEVSSNYEAYFIKDNKWMKDSKTNILINRIVENIHLGNVKIGENIRLINNDFSYEQGRNHIENLAAELNLYRCYFYGELTYDRISEDNESSHEYFIQPIEKNNYERQRLLKRGILIFDLRKVNDGNLLKQEIKSDVKRNFACVVRLTNQHYITLFIENKQPDKFNCDIRYIYVLISTDSEIDFSMLTRFTGVMDKCVYKLSIVECPQQRSMSEDRLLHSYLNATASQWAADSECWKALKDNFYRQKFSGRENIEKLKKWFIKDI